MDYIAQMQNLKKEHEFFIGFDSDGCIFDTMEIKQKECFCPNFVNFFGMQAASKYAREVWEFVNLYSKTRGCNRFPAVQRALQLLRERQEIKARGIAVPLMNELDQWLVEETKLGNPALKAKVAANPTEQMKTLLAWSLAVNDAITDMVHGIPPFPGVKEVLASAAPVADMIVVSQTPLEALTREWEENKIDHYLKLICGQEHGTKTEHLRYVTKDKYAPDKVLMVGDAPGDQKAAQSNGVLFFPIIPGREEQCWAELNREGLQRFFKGTFGGVYQEALLREFDLALPEKPSWK
jgi:phosphoglycolate phosphatase-like HAD superfamily hydrolase